MPASISWPASAVLAKLIDNGTLGRSGCAFGALWSTMMTCPDSIVLRHLLRGGDPGLLIEHAKVMVVTRRSHPTHLCRVKIDTLRADEPSQNKIAVERADGQTVRLGNAKNVVGRNQAAGARLVVHYGRGVAGNILA